MVFISDQFEVEPISAYKNSYTDRIFIGDFLSGSVPFFNSFGQVGKYRILLGSNLYKFREVWEEKYYTTHVSGTIIPDGYEMDIHFLHLIMNERFLSPQKNLRTKFTTAGEIYADSVMPFPPDISLINGAQFSRGYIEHEDPNTSLGIPGLTGSFNIVLSTPEAPVTCSNDDSQVSDNAWAFSFPFEGKYRTARRFLRADYSINFPIPISQSRNDHEILDEFSTAPLTGSLFTLQFVIPRVHSVATNNNAFRAVLLECTDTIVNEQADDGSPVFISGKPWFVPRSWSIINSSVPFPGSGFSPRKWPSINNVYRAFYGFYDEAMYSINFVGAKRHAYHLSKFPVLNRITLPADSNFWSGPFLESIEETLAVHSWPPTNLATEDNPVGLWAGYLRINGFKYGCIHANKLVTGCFFRRNRFGQFRDMLEQRPNTKFYDPKAGTPLAAAVVATFISGSDPWVTASNPDLNTHDSGVWDFEGKSGKPFDDRGPKGYKSTES